MTRRLMFMASAGAAVAFFAAVHWSDADAKEAFAGAMMALALWLGWERGAR